MKGEKVGLDVLINYRPIFFESEGLKDFQLYLSVQSHTSRSWHCSSVLFIRLVAKCYEIDFEEEVWGKLTFFSLDGKETMTIPKISIVRDDDPTLHYQIFDYPPALLEEDNWWTTDKHNQGLIICNRETVSSLKGPCINDEDLVFEFRVKLYGIETILARKASGT